jgi:hypothetical protein
LKKDLIRNKHSLGKVRIGRYVDYLEEKLQSDCLKVEFEIPARSIKPRRKKKTQDTERERDKFGGASTSNKDDDMAHDELNETYENWRGKVDKDKKGKGTFFNKRHILNQVYKM